MTSRAASPTWSIFSRRDALRAAMVLLALSLGYYAGVLIGVKFTLAPHAVSMLWPPNAILLGALLLAPPRTWPWLILAVLPAHLIAELSAGVPLLMVGSWYVSNVTEALLAASIIHFVLRAAPRFDRVRDVAVYLLAALIVSPVVSSLLDAGLVAWVGWRYEGDYWGVFRMRLFSNALAAVIVPPLIVAAVRSELPALLRSARAVQLEAAALFVGLCLTSFLIFHETQGPGLAAMYVCAPLPFLIWAAVRIGAGGVSVCVAALALFSITGTLQGTGPFSLTEPIAAVYSLQIFITVNSASLMVLAAALAELRDARAAADSRKERLDLALKAAEMGAWEWNLVTDQVTWRLAQSSSDSSARSLSAAQVVARVHPDDRERVRAAMRAAREAGGAGEAECRFIDNETRWIRAVGTVQRDDADRPCKMIGVWIDATERKRQELQQRAQRERLSRLTRAAALGEMSGALAHELSQPLAAIVLNSQAGRTELRKAKLDIGELDAILLDNAADGQRAGEVISRLRSLFPRDAFELERVQPAECIGSVAALEANDLAARNIAVDLDIDPRLPTVRASPHQLQQVLLHLIANASEAMAGQSARPRLRIAARRQADEVQITVSDNGPGVADFARVFEPFYTTKPSGVGLGLSICRTIVAAHGGRLWGTRNEEGGATFHIALPIWEPPGEAPAVQAVREGSA